MESPDPIPTTTPEASTPSEHLIVPGKRVGPITARTTEAALREAFAGHRIEAAQVELGEGVTAEGLRIDAGAPTALSVLWTGPDRTRVTQVRELGPAWRTAEGIGRGSTLPEVEAVLGPFEFTGLAWDYAGTVLFEGTRRPAWAGGLVLRLTPTVPAPAELPIYDQIQGDLAFPSTTPGLAALGLVVGDVIVVFEEPLNRADAP